jgi:anti-anti-sigma regulatory factor
MAELNRTCQDLAGRAGARGVVLDLAEVFFIDAEGIALLATLSSSGVSLTNVSLFVAEQLKGVGHAGM